MFEDLECFCLFIGYSKSGHSLVASILDAHPNIIISDEVDALRMVARGRPKEVIFKTIAKNSKRCADGSRVRAGYDYSIKNLFAGVATELKVLGDKKGGRSSMQVRLTPGVISEVHERIGLPIKWIHVIRNPLDNLVSWYLSYKAHTFGVRFKQFREMCEGVRLVREKEDVIDVYLEKFIRHPRIQTQRLCDFLGVEAKASYLDICTKLVWKQPKRRANEINWGKAKTRMVKDLTNDFDWFHYYYLRNE